jgi:hypothetical protein
VLPSKDAPNVLADPAIAAKKAKTCPVQRGLLKAAINVEIRLFERNGRTASAANKLHRALSVPENGRDGAGPDAGDAGKARHRLRSGYPFMVGRRKAPNLAATMSHPLRFTGPLSTGSYRKGRVTVVA